jgi:hypothetical protein
MLYYIQFDSFYKSGIPSDNMDWAFMDNSDFEYRWSRGNFGKVKGKYYFWNIDGEWECK